MNERSHKDSRVAVLRAPLLIALLGVGIVYFIWIGVKALKDKSQSPTEPVAVSADAGSVSLDNSTAAPDTSEQQTQTTEPASTTGEAAPVSTTEPVTTEPVATEPLPQMMTVDDRYFSDALFIGDSRTDGLWLYSTPGACKHYSGTSMTIFKIMDTDAEAYGFTGLRNLLKGMQFGKIYIMFGINECGYDTGKFAEKYREVVEEIRSYQPDALIYIQSICYVTQKHETKYPVFSTANIKEKNEAIKVLANDKDIFYLEINDCLNDGTDHLPSDYTGDGVHLKANYYRYWHDYLLEHAVVDANHPWQPEEETASEPEGAEVEHP